MKTLTVTLPGRSYDILIGSGLLHQAGGHLRHALPRAKKLFVVTDSNVAPIYLSALTAGLEGSGFETACRVVPAGEGSKSAAVLSALWEDMMDFGLTRTDAVAALGGAWWGTWPASPPPPSSGEWTSSSSPPPSSPRWTPPWGEGGHRPPAREEPGRGLLAAQGGPHGHRHPGHPGRPHLCRRHGRGRQIRLHLRPELLRLPGRPAQPGRPHGGDRAHPVYLLRPEADGGGGGRAGHRTADAPQLRPHPGPRLRAGGTLRDVEPRPGGGPPACAPPQSWG